MMASGKLAAVSTIETLVKVSRSIPRAINSAASKITTVSTILKRASSFGRRFSLQFHLIQGNSNAFFGVSYTQVALAQRCISTEGCGGAAPHHLPFGNDVMTVGNAAQGRDVFINE